MSAVAFDLIMFLRRPGAAARLNAGSCVIFNTKYSVNK